MITVDLFHLVSTDQHLGHVRILRNDNQQGNGQQFVAIASFPHELPYDDTPPNSSFDTHRLEANSRKAAIDAVLTWANHRFDGRCSLQTIQSVSPAGNDNSYA